MGVHEIAGTFLENAARFPFYNVIFLTKGTGTYKADIGTFTFRAPVLLFSTPLQKLAIQHECPLAGFAIQFHGDFYCIEYHKERVSCNGLLFNNIYIEPSVNLGASDAETFCSLCADMIEEFSANEPDEVVLRSYLQLFLAKSSSIKLKTMAGPSAEREKDEQMEAFMRLLEQNYLSLHKPADYARLLAMTPNTLTKKSQRYFGKSPSLMIQERLVLEAKKKLHLTRQSIKEIAYALNFSDEFYFSRFFKKFTKVSPQSFRDQTGISIVADME
ncbi:MAG: helix-turn-helix domain-containing protein [Mucilaginibacter sp.]